MKNSIFSTTLKSAITQRPRHVTEQRTERSPNMLRVFDTLLLDHHMPYRKSPSDCVTGMITQRLRDVPHNVTALIMFQSSDKETTIVYHLFKIETDAYTDFFSWRVQYVERNLYQKGN